MLYQMCDGATQPAFLWFENEMCYFSLGSFANEDESQSGKCTIPGHQSIGEDYDYSILQVDMEYYSQSDHTYKGLYDPDSANWGPTGEHTDLKFYSAPEGDNCATWLWERTDEYCAACSQDGGYPDMSYFGDGSSYTYYEEYSSQAQADASYSFGEFDATNQYDTVEFEEEE